MGKCYLIQTSQSEFYTVNERGHIGYSHWQHSASWVLLGMSNHHWCTSPTIRWPELQVMLDRGESVRGYIWDVDHGTTRQWGSARKCTIHKTEMRQ